jgi:hypothetical protein
MFSNKCKNCGLVNKAHDHVCHRCGCLLYDKNSAGPRGPREAAKSSSFLYTLLAIALLGGAVYYVVTGFEKSYDQIKTDEIKRLAAQPKISPAPFTSRSEYDQRRTEPYKNAVANSPNLGASQKHNDAVKQLMRPANASR